MKLPEQEFKKHSARIRTGKILTVNPFLGNKRTRIKSTDREQDDEDDSDSHIPPNDPISKRKKLKSEYHIKN